MLRLVITLMLFRLLPWEGVAVAASTTTATAATTTDTTATTTTTTTSQLSAGDARQKPVVDQQDNYTDVTNRLQRHDDVKLQNVTDQSQRHIGVKSHDVLDQPQRQNDVEAHELTDRPQRQNDVESRELTDRPQSQNDVERQRQTDQRQRQVDQRRRQADQRQRQTDQRQRQADQRHRQSDQRQRQADQRQRRPDLSSLMPHQVQRQRRHSKMARTSHSRRWRAAEKRYRDGLSNVALNKPAWLSSRNFFFTSTRAANDGDRRNRRQSYCVHTKRYLFDFSPWRWWRVDLLKIYHIHHVTITNRGDCCGNELRNFDIRVAKTLSDRNGPKQDDDKLCVHYGPAVGTGATLQFNCTSSLLFGRYVTVLMPSQRSMGHSRAALHLCEVEVYGREPLLQQPGRSCEQSASPDRPVVCSPGLVCADWRGQGRLCQIIAGDVCKISVSQYCLAPFKCVYGICRVLVGGDCTGREDTCQPSSICDTNKICKWKPELRNCSPKTCISTAVCDSRKICKLRNGQPCKKDGQCLAGAECVNGNCRCSPQGSVLNNQTFMCDPKEGRIGGPCIGGASGTCYDPEVTVCTNGKCACKPGTPVIIQDYSCRTKEECKTDSDCGEGQVCSNPGLSSAKCDTNSVCDSDELCDFGQVCENPATSKAKCTIALGHNCTGSSIGCKTGAECDTDGVCKLKLDQDCSDYPLRCKSGTECDRGQRCRIKLGLSCSSSSECGETAQCDSVGSAVVCRVKTGKSCAEDNIHNCNSEAVCDEGFICRQKLGKPCSVSNPCTLGTVCDGKVNKTCKKRLGVECSRQNGSDPCQEGTVCDSLSSCRVKAGFSCSPGDDACSAGTTCNPGTKTCACNSALATNGSADSCVPKEKKVGGRCSSACEDPNAVCRNGICVCKPGFGVDRGDLRCKAGAGKSCAEDSQTCAAGTVCDVGHVCQLEVGQNCAGTNRAHCRTDALCGKDDICRLNINGACAGGREKLCRSGAVCDALGKCFSPVGQKCYHKDRFRTCVAGSTCLDGYCKCNPKTSVSTSIGTCEPKPKKVGGRCAPAEGASACDDANAVCSFSAGANRCECGAVFSTEEDFTCKKNAGQSCTADHSLCISGTTCDSSGTCRLNPGSGCILKSSDSFCGSDSVCDEDSKCRLNYRSNCSDIRSSQCRRGTICDNLMMCHIPVFGNCSQVDYCVSGSTCSDGVCVCNPNVTTTSGLICIPLMGLVGGDCDPVYDPCLDPNAECDIIYRTCTCRSGFTVDRQLYSCIRAGVPSTDEETLNTATIGLIATAVTALVAMAITAVFSYRRRMQALNLVATVEERKREWEKIRQLAVEAETLTADGKHGGGGAASSVARDEISTFDSSSAATEDTTV